MSIINIVYMFVMLVFTDRCSIDSYSINEAGI